MGQAGEPGIQGNFTRPLDEIASLVLVFITDMNPGKMTQRRSQVFAENTVSTIVTLRRTVPQNTREYLLSVTH